MSGQDVNTGTRPDIEVILNDLYANEINASISWIEDHGFCATLGNLALAENRFGTSGQAVRWLKHQALVHFPRSEFADASNRDGAQVEAILDDLYTGNIPGSISWIWDGGFYVTLGEPKQAEGWAFPTVAEAVVWLRDQAIAHYPESEFARKHAGFGI